MNGPWMISPYCESQQHNNKHVAQKRGSQLACICPRAVALRADILAARRVPGKPQRKSPTVGRKGPARERSSTRDVRGTILVEKLPAYIMNVRKVNHLPMDLSMGACRTPGGIKIMDAVGGKLTKGVVAAAKGICETCPVRRACLEEAMEKELPAGAWGGVWGGMSPQERKKEADARA